MMGLSAAQVIQVKGVDNKLVQVIMDEIVEGGAKVGWSDIAGQEVSVLFANYHFPTVVINFNCLTFRWRNKRCRKW